MESFFVLEQSDCVVWLELALVAIIVSMKIFRNGVLQHESLSAQMIFTWVVMSCCVGS